MRRVAFATCRQTPALTEDDQRAATALSERGIEVHPAVWNSPDVAWGEFDLVVIRSTWDYPEEPAAYARWLQSFLARPGRLQNPPSVVLSTLDKRYLLDLGARGVSIVPTIIIPARDNRSLAAIIDHAGWDEVVVKPAISASARGTWRSRRERAAADQARFAAASLTQDLLVQPFCGEIVERGEWSLIFLGGEYSHAALKRPASDDFRVQRHFGGNPVPAVAPARLVEQAAAVLEGLGRPLLYARVDGIERAGDLVLMELEVNEPYLFFSFSLAAPARFAAVVARALAR